MDSSLPQNVSLNLLHCFLPSGLVDKCAVYLSGKEPHGWIGVGRLVMSGSLGGIMVRILNRNARDLGSIPAL